MWDISTILFLIAAVIFGIGAWMGKSLTDLGLAVLAFAFFLQSL